MRINNKRIIIRWNISRWNIVRCSIGLHPLLFLAALNVFPLTPFNLYSQSESEHGGEEAMAMRYTQWAMDSIGQGLWNEALTALERASDFANVSSDLSYLLALVRSHENKPIETVLAALNTALATDRWILHKPEAARLFKAENLIAVRAYTEALTELAGVSSNPEETALTLKALSVSRPVEFLNELGQSLNRYPRESAPLRVFFSFLKREEQPGLKPDSDEIRLLELILRRLPLLLDNDPELAWMAAPYMRDTDEARRLVSAYRAVNTPVEASLPAALSLGIIDEETAMYELFAANDRQNALDIALLSEIWELLRREEARDIFKQYLSTFTGFITKDNDRDGIPEERTEYLNGMLKSYSYDSAQDGIPALTVFFEAGAPKSALVLIPPEAKAGIPLALFAEPPESADPARKSALVVWEQYPALLELEFDNAKYTPLPFEFFYSPIIIDTLWGSGLLFPQRDPLSPPLTRRVMVSRSIRVERPSVEFSGGVEIVELNGGIPERAREYSGELLVSETEFLRGRPQLQRVDLDFDGWFDTARHFRRNFRQMELEELWNYDRDFDYVESLQDEP